MFQTQFKELLKKISEIEYKLQNYRQLLNQQIQFNLKDLYIALCGNITVTAYHLQKFINSFPSELLQPQDTYSQQQEDEQQQQQTQINQSNKLCELESIIKSYNNCTSMNLTFIQLSLMFLSKENNLLSKLTLQRQRIGHIPLFLKNYIKKIILLQCQLHCLLIQFRKKWSNQAELWIKQHTVINQVTNQQEIDEKILGKICQQVGIDCNLIVQNFKVTGKESLKYEHVMCLLTLRNCVSVGVFVKAVGNGRKNAGNMKKMRNGGYQMNNNNKSKKNNTNKLSQSQNPYIRPQFNDCLTRQTPLCQQISNFSHRQYKSIQKHITRITSPQHSQPIITKIQKYTKTLHNHTKIFLKHLQQIITLEKQLQFNKIQLSLCTDFYPILFFDSFHKDTLVNKFNKVSVMGEGRNIEQQLLLSSLLKEYLDNFGIVLPMREIYLLFRRYSRRNDGRLAFNQFCGMFDLSERNRKYYSNIQKNREINALSDIDIETKKIYLQVLKNLIKHQTKIQKIKQKLYYYSANTNDIMNKDKQIHKNINLRDIFSYIDNDNDGYISQTDLRVIWKKILGINISEDEIIFIWHRMLPDYNSNNNRKQQIGDNNQNIYNVMISYEEFIMEMVPKTKQIKVLNKELSGEKDQKYYKQKLKKVKEIKKGSKKNKNYASLVKI